MKGIHVPAIFFTDANTSKFLVHLGSAHQHKPHKLEGAIAGFETMTEFYGLFKILKDLTY